MKFVRLNIETEKYINTIVTEIPELNISLDTFSNLLTTCPPKVKILNRKDLETSKEFEDILKVHYSQWIRLLYKRLFLYGICPWYYEKIPKTIHKYPVVPPVESGYIETIYTKNHKQRFKWTWYTGKSATKVYFTTSDNAPSILGQFKSSITSLIPYFKTLKIAKITKEKSWKDQIVSQYVVEYSPSNDVTQNDNNLINSRFMGRENGNDPTNVRNIRVKEAERAIKRTKLQNEMLINGGYIEPSQEQLENLGKGLYLRADFKYKQLNSFKVDANVDELEKTLSQKLNIILDFPSLRDIQMYKNNTFLELQLRFINQRIIHWKGFLEKQLKITIVNAYKKEFEDRDVDKILNVELTCTSLITYEELKEVYNMGLISKNTFAEKVFRIKNLPYSDIEIELPPKKKTKKELE